MDLCKGQILDMLDIFEQYNDCATIEQIRNDINYTYTNDTDLVLIGLYEIDDYAQ